MGFSCLKRRNAQTSVRRALKRNKATEGFFGSSIVYIKCLLIWAVLLAVDYLLDFRFEYLWPVWMLLRSVYDSFKFQGVLLAALFGGLAIASDVVCYMLVPAHCLFFLASSYVWVQYVSHTERGVCLPTAMLWLIFLYIEYTVRLRDVKQSSMSFTLDLCRPFAAHCVGYPVVTLGFGCKSYIQYKLRLKKQSQVRKHNEQYFDMVKQALPIELQHPNGTCVAESSAHENGVQEAQCDKDKLSDCNDTCPSSSTNSLQNGASHASSSCNTASSNAQSHSKPEPHKRRNQSHVTSSAGGNSTAYMQLSSLANGCATNNSRESSTQRRPKLASEFTSPLANGHALSSAAVECNGASTDSNASATTNANANATRAEGSAKPQSAAKDDLIVRLESELRRLRSDLQSARYTESELRSQISIYEKHEREARENMQQLRHDRDTFETKLNGLQQKLSAEKQALDRQLREERRLRQSCDEKLSNLERERDELRAQLQAQAQAVQLAASTQQQSGSTTSGSQRTSSLCQQNSAATSSKTECNGDCRSARKKLENENRQLREHVARKTDELNKLDNEKLSLSVLRQSQADVHERELKQAQERASHLEKTLSDENRVKMDLVAALGEAKRQLELSHVAARSRELEMAEMKRTHELISTLLPGLNLNVNLAGLPVSSAPLGHAHVLTDASLPSLPAAHYLASQNGTSHSSPSSTPLPFNSPSCNYSAATSGTPYNTVPTSACSYHTGLYQNAPSVYDAFGGFSPFGVAPAPSPTAFSPSMSAAIEAQQRARSPSVSSASQSGDAAQKSWVAICACALA